MESGGSTTDPQPSAGSAEQGAIVDLTDPGCFLGAVQRDGLREFLGGALAILNISGEVRIRLVDDAQMVAAHARYSGDASTTDVLTFDLSDGPNGGAGARREHGARSGLDVDLLLCFDQAVREARSRGHRVEQELVLYALHGVLHCLGYDDHDEDGARRMHEEEDRVLTAIGVGALFGGPLVSDHGAPRGVCS